MGRSLSACAGLSPSRKHYQTTGNRAASCVLAAALLLVGLLSACSPSSGSVARDDTVRSQPAAPSVIPTALSASGGSGATAVPAPFSVEYSVVARTVNQWQ